MASTGHKSHPAVNIVGDNTAESFFSSFSNTKQSINWGENLNLFHNCTVSEIASAVNQNYFCSYKQ